MRVLIGCEFSGVVRRAFRARGFDAWSCDLLPADDDSPYHLQADVRDVLRMGWTAAVLHPPCTRLANSGVRWLHERGLWAELDEGAALFSDCWNAPIPFVAVENPIMHRHAKARIVNYQEPAQTVQPWWFGDPFFKATSLWLRNLPALVPTNRLTPPKKADEPERHKQWSMIHRASPGPNRGRDRSVTFPGIANAMASQWGDYIREHARRTA